MNITLTVCGTAPAPYSAGSALFTAALGMGLSEERVRALLARVEEVPFGHAYSISISEGSVMFHTWNRQEFSRVVSEMVSG